MTKDPKGKKGGEKVKKEGRKLSALYNISSDKVERKNRTCPKCGPGMFLGNHKDRVVCGSCQYMEVISKKEDTGNKVSEGSKEPVKAE